MPLNSSQLIVADINTYPAAVLHNGNARHQGDDPPSFSGRAKLVALIDAQIYAYKKSGGKS
jgi:hypothetical protein